MKHTNGHTLREKFENDIVVLSHLRWDFVFQRPQHLLTRAANARRVFFFEEPIVGAREHRSLEISQREGNIWVVQPHLPDGLPHEETVQALMHLLDDLLSECQIKDYVLWYYTPMARSFTRHLQPSAIVFDCMDELSLFKHAPKELIENEAELMKTADVVFTGGQSLYEAKKDRHHNIHAFPSSIDYLHFCQARRIAKSKHEPDDQKDIAHPRMGFYGVIDERFDIELLRDMADARPDWSFILIGPTAKIDPNDLPKNPNIHYLGPKSYQELPAYLAGWDVAMMPFAKNDSTKFISPTKTPEFLAAAKPVVSTSIQDVVRPYGELGLVKIADEAATFIKAAAQCGMDERALPDDWLEKVDQFLAKNSWDRTWSRMEQLITTAVMARQAAPAQNRTHQAKSLQTNNSEPSKLSAQVA